MVKYTSLPNVCFYWHRQGHQVHMCPVRKQGKTGKGSSGRQGETTLNEKRRATQGGRNEAGRAAPDASYNSRNVPKESGGRHRDHEREEARFYFKL
ncbi:hypothetical protein R1flu_019365 [Riccia fluitans]|uniref:Uncharacterized protein n=1 Tax=Riccia fluitans TaxID=41844 RepID=A0ABD1ZIS9_9MARC